MDTFLADFILDDAKAISDSVDFREIKNKTFLVTGASGLIGHYVIAAIKRAAASGNAPAKVFMAMKNDRPPYFDRLATGLPVEVLNGDLTNDDVLRNLPAADYIIHGAGYGQPGKFMAAPVKTLKLNTVATFKLLESKLNPGGKFLFISSSEVYSGLENPPYREDQIGTTNTNHPRSCYIEGKRGGEAIVNAYRQKGAQAKSIRLSLAYGPGTKADDARVLNNIIKKAVVEKKIVLLDQGLAQRTYLYVTDAVEMLFKILFFGVSDIYNVGGKSRTTIGELAQAVGRFLNVPVVIPTDSSGGLAGAPNDVILDTTKIADEFEKVVFVPFDQGLEKTIAWQKKLYSS
jgi:nucleoside-diphosphate-sugar epimerase